MGEDNEGPDKPESVENGNVPVDEKTEALAEKKEVVHDGGTEMEVETKDDSKSGAEDMDVDKEKDKGTEIIESEKNEHVVEGKKDEGNEEIIEEQKQETAEDGKVLTKSEEVGLEYMDKIKEAEDKNEGEAEDKVGEEVDGVEEGERLEKSKEEKAPKKRKRTKIRSGRKDKHKKKEDEEQEPKTRTKNKTKEPKMTTDKKEEPQTPAALTIDRPVRERKSVERLVAIIDKDATKELHVEKGRGTALKDIPNVAYKLTRKKTENTFKLLHTILFGRRGKASQVKNNISRFSGFVWHDNEEKHNLKIKEKLDKIVKEKLLEFCDVLDIPIAVGARKEDIIAKLIEFLAAPHVTTTELLAEKEQSSKGKKRKRVNNGASGSSTPSLGSAKSRNKNESKINKGKGAESTPIPEDDSEEKEEACQKDEDINHSSERSMDEMPEQAENEEKTSESEESDKDKGMKKRRSTKPSVRKGSIEKSKTKKETLSKKVSPPPKTLPGKSPPNRSKSDKATDAKRPSGKKKDESIKNKTSTQKKSSSSLSIGKKLLKVKEKPEEEKLKPSDDELRNAICEILKEVDFNTATFTDILKLLAKRFGGDLTPRKSSIKHMIQDELTKIADAEEADDEEDEGVAGKDEKNPSTQRVEA